MANRMPPTLTLPLKWGGNQKYVPLNLFQNLAIVANRMPPTLTLPPSLRFGNRVAQLVPRWLPLFLKWGGNQKYVILNLFQNLAIVTNRMPPHPNPPPQVGREPKVCHPEFISGSQEKDLFTYLLILFRLSVGLLPKFQG